MEDGRGNGLDGMKSRETFIKEKLRNYQKIRYKKLNFLLGLKRQGQEDQPRWNRIEKKNYRRKSREKVAK